MSFTFGNMNFEAVVFLPNCASKQAKHNESLVERQMIKVLARPTNNVEQFCGQRRGGKFKCQHSQNFALVSMRFLASTSSTHLLSFVSMS